MLPCRNDVFRRRDQQMGRKIGSKSNGKISTKRNVSLSGFGGKGNFGFYLQFSRFEEANSQITPVFGWRQKNATRVQSAPLLVRLAVDFSFDAEDSQIWSLFRSHFIASRSHFDRLIRCGSGPEVILELSVGRKLSFPERGLFRRWWFWEMEPQ